MQCRDVSRLAIDETDLCVDVHRCLGVDCETRFPSNSLPNEKCSRGSQEESTAKKAGRFRNRRQMCRVHHSLCDSEMRNLSVKLRYRLRLNNELITITATKKKMRPIIRRNWTNSLPGLSSIVKPNSSVPKNTIMSSTSEAIPSSKR